MKYLDRLKSNFEKRPTHILTKLTKAHKGDGDELTKPTKAPSVSFVSTKVRHFQKNDFTAGEENTPGITLKNNADEQPPRLPGCKAYPTSGVIAGVSVEWCKQSRGEWCGGCRWNR